MARYGRDYGWKRGGHYYGQGDDFRGRGGYDRGYEGGWGMEGLFNSITGRAGERGYGRDYRAGSRYDRDFSRRVYEAGRRPSPFGGTNQGRSRFGSGYGGSERGEDWGRPGARWDYDRSFGNARIERNRYDRGWF